MWLRSSFAVVQIEGSTCEEGEDPSCINVSVWSVQLTGNVNPFERVRRFALGRSDGRRDKKNGLLHFHVTSSTIAGRSVLKEEHWCVEKLRTGEWVLQEEDTLVTSNEKS